MIPIVRSFISKCKTNAEDEQPPSKTRGDREGTEMGQEGTRGGIVVSQGFGVPNPFDNLPFSSTPN